MFDTAHIALIDSGIGGLSILNCIEQRMSGANVSYFMDNRYLPYGDLPSQQLVERLQDIVAFLQRVEPDLVVIACNTASVQSLEFLRQRFEIPFVGVVPAIKPAAKLTQSGRIGVLATPATVNGCYVEDLIGKYAADCDVVCYGSTDLVRLAEQQFWQFPASPSDVVNKLAQELTVFELVDTLVLGCTHFPLIAEQINHMVADGVVLVDSGDAIARRVEQLLQSQSSFQFGHHAKRQFKQLFCSAALTKKQQLRLNEFGFGAIDLVEI